MRIAGYTLVTPVIKISQKQPNHLNSPNCNFYVSLQKKHNNTTVIHSFRSTCFLPSHKHRSAATYHLLQRIHHTYTTLLPPPFNPLCKPHIASDAFRPLRKNHVLARLPSAHETTDCCFNHVASSVLCFPYARNTLASPLVPLTLSFVFKRPLALRLSHSRPCNT